jgi:hypothetical protein
VTHSSKSNQFNSPSCSQADLVDADTAARFLRLSKSDLECRANANLSPQYLTRHPLTYLSETLVDYACDKKLSNLAADRAGAERRTSRAQPAGNIPNDPKLARLATGRDYKLFLRSIEDEIPHPATHAITISFNRHGTEYAGMAPRQFNEEVGGLLRQATINGMGMTLRRFAKVYSLYGWRSKSNYPFWLQGERYSKQRVSEVYLHLHGSLFIPPSKLDDFTKKVPYFEGYLVEAFKKSLCPVDLLLEEIKTDDGGFSNYSLKHINTDVRAFEWFVTNVRS